MPVLFEKEQIFLTLSARLFSKPSCNTLQPQKRTLLSIVGNEAHVYTSFPLMESVEAMYICLIPSRYARGAE